MGLRSCGVLLLGVFCAACVPKTRFDDEEAKLHDTQTKLKSLEASSAECDKDAFIQLKEQSQSLDLLTQELVDRNTELSKEVARLRVAESSSKSEGMNWTKKLEAQKADYEQKLERTRATYEDVIKDLKTENQKLQEALAAAREVKKKPATKQKH